MVAKFSVSIVESMEDSIHFVFACTLSNSIYSEHTVGYIIVS